MNFDPYANQSVRNDNKASNDGISVSNDEETRKSEEFLGGHRFPSGLRRTLLEAHRVQQRYSKTQHNVMLPPNRIWILDNSAYMKVADSHKISGTYDNLQNVPNTTRWEELCDCVAYQLEVAQVLKLPMCFCLVNDPGPSVGPRLTNIGQNNFTNIANEVQVLQRVMTTSRLDGKTVPLSKNLGFVKGMIMKCAPELRRQNQTVTIVLATQGRPTDEQGQRDQNFTSALQAFEGLPVNIVLRLCTDDEDVIDYYNSLDKFITDIEYDVLDDFFGEALEVYLRNHWLTYGLPLHRYREMGFQSEFLDALDERSLTRKEVRDLCALLFSNTFPDPDLNWDAFLQSLSTVISNEEEQWNPVTQKKMPWIDLVHLNRIYGEPMNQQKSEVFTQQHNFQQQQQQQSQQQQQQQSQQQQQYQQQYQQQQKQQQQQQQQQQRQQQWQQQWQQPDRPNAGVTQEEATPKPNNTNEVVTESEIRKKIMIFWALQPPGYQTLQPIGDLLSTVQSILPPAIAGVETHSYFEKWVPVTKHALSSGPLSVLRRAVRKMQFFLHPDKLPHDFSDMQKRFCRELWDIISEAWDIYKTANNI